MVTWKWRNLLMAVGGLTCFSILLHFFLTLKYNAEGKQINLLEKPRVCPDTLDKRTDINAEIVRNYPVLDSGPYLKDLGLVYTDEDKTVPEHRPIVVTAGNSEVFGKSWNHIQWLKNSIFPKFGKLKVIYYDLGLRSSQHEMIRKECQCEIRYFPFDKYPSHVRNIRGFAWKPIIIQTVLKVHGFVMWMDSSVRTNYTDLEALFQQTQKHGIALHFSPNPGYSLAESTDPKTFRMFGEQPCTFRNVSEFYATAIVVHKSTYVLRHIMRPWLSCALTNGCMSIKSRDSRAGCPINMGRYGVCHRFDQSVLSIILHRLYHNSQNKLQIADPLVKCGVVNRYPAFSFLPDFVVGLFFNAEFVDSCD